MSRDSPRGIARPAETLHLVKGSEGWRLVAPQSVKADPVEVDALLGSLESLESDEVVSETPGDLATYGLAQPQTTVTVVREGSPDALRVQLGEKTPDGSAYYAKLPTAARVFTISPAAASETAIRRFRWLSLRRAPSSAATLCAGTDSE